ncbi:twin-arginine translocase TatA/TatE family subunit [uncultured Selenomonas sp.]|jgi:sec-independent protein translocase protein tatA/E homolog|uniref:Sec-independent protein translocase subunit TatA/TatB n=1 Tax=uncultured Selenomonas sp. TaxID=159275 RepID=UPI0028E46A9E|nr:twin-arginine translocase TatA/TatE family subunit [uncultured Selenomonas sp.]
MFGIGVPELILILVVGLIVFGPGKLPEMGRSLGKGIREFRKASNALTAAINTPEPPPAPPAAQPAQTVQATTEAPAAAPTPTATPTAATAAAAVEAHKAEQNTSNTENRA